MCPDYVRFCDVSVTRAATYITLPTIANIILVSDVCGVDFVSGVTLQIAYTTEMSDRIEHAKSLTYTQAIEQTR